MAMTTSFLTLSFLTLSQIVTLHEEGYSQVEISQKLGVHKSTVSKTLARYLNMVLLIIQKKIKGPKLMQNKDFIELEKF